MEHSSEQDRLYHELTQTYGGAMMRLACSTEANIDKRQDLIQIMNVELWKSLAQFDGRCSKKTWVYRVIHNVTGTYVKREMRRNRPSIGLDDIAELPSLIDTQLDIEKHDALAKLHTWIRQLTMPDRQILLLYLEDMSSAEIAEITGLKPGTISTRISRLKSKLTLNFKETNNE